MKSVNFPIRFLCALCLFAFAFPSITVQGVQVAEKEAPAAEADDKDQKIETVEVETRPIRVYETFDGRFESSQVKEVTSEFESWSDLEIQNVTEEGAAVSAGQELLVFNTESIDKAIAEAEFALKNSEFSVLDSRLAMKEIMETFDLDSQLVEDNWKNTKEDYEYYQKVTIPQRKKDMAYDQRSSGYFLEYSKDELDQLEQMYTEDELTEESEEIVLKRARRSVESAQRSMDRSLRRLKKQKELDNPRQDLGRANGFKRAGIEYEKAKVKLPIKKQKAEIALARAEFDLKNKQKALADLKADRGNMTLSSPTDGVLYYGRCIRGKWVGASGSTARRMEVGKKLPANKVLMTIVDVNKLMIRADLDEEELAALSSATAGQSGKALVKAAKGAVLPVMVKSASRIPLDNGKFDCQLAVSDYENLGIMPGMSCKVSFPVYENNEAVVAPKASVFSDDGISHYVYLVKDGESQRTNVVVGQKSGDWVEIKGGVSKGDLIAKKKP